MHEQSDLFPVPGGLSRAQLEQLKRLADAVGDCPVPELQRRAREHVDRTRQAQLRAPFVNARFAEAIADKVDDIAREWETIPVSARYWLRGAIEYFVHSVDGEPDFGSVIGFEDDAEVLNACLRLAGRLEWQLKPEDYDNA